MSVAKSEEIFEKLKRVSCYMQHFIMYYGSALLLFIHKLHCLQTFEHMSPLLAIKA